MHSKAERLDLFFKALLEAPNASSIDAAHKLLSETLVEIEDRYSGVPRGNGDLDDGRMYPPRSDARRTVSGRPDLGRYRARWHYIYYSTGGAILIASVEGKLMLSKPGADGRRIIL